MYYDKFSTVYDFLSPKLYYHKARNEAIKELRLSKGNTVLNVPVGTGQNFDCFQHYLDNTGLIIGIDLSAGMLRKAQNKIDKNHWGNIHLINQDVATLSERLIVANKTITVNAVLCDLGLSGFSDWQAVIDSLIDIVGSGNRISIMDWYIEKPSLRGNFVKWIGKGDVNRPIGQYLETKVTDFKLNSSFNRGGVFVASGTTK